MRALAYFPGRFSPFMVTVLTELRKSDCAMLFGKDGLLTRDRMQLCE